MQPVRPKFEDRKFNNFEQAFKEYFATSEYNDITRMMHSMAKTAFIMGWIAAGGACPIYGLSDNVGESEKKK